MATIVQDHDLPKAREAAAEDTERVRKFILKRRGEILADLTPEPPDWPEPEAAVPLTARSGTLEVAFSTSWGSNLDPNPLEAGTTIEPGAYMQFSTDKDGWPGFALGGDEELGIWLANGTGVDRVDWDEGQSGEGQSYARVPDATGDFQTVNTPTPGAPNQS